MSIECPKCHSKNLDDSKFCKECASPLPLSEEKARSHTKTLHTPVRDLIKGTTFAGRYQIIEELGRGGMGVVYKAKDGRLDRTVALKFLASELIINEEAKRRFIQEAKAAAALNHPQICTVYEVDETDNQSFISMEFLDGQSLRDKLKSGPLDVDEAQSIIIKVAEGLKEAHEKGIVHRDIKPANIMLTARGEVKITDFGLAKLSGGIDLTKTSTIMGTVAYMSPEQAAGEEVDHRTDIWSLGILFYEMLAGVRPFNKTHEQALIYSILNDNPDPVSALRSDVPDHIERLIRKALEKDASKRIQSMDEFVNALKNLSFISHQEDDKSIAVLPFTNMSADPEQEYFCDGMVEEIINSLSKIKDLRVVAKTSSFSFKGKNIDIRDIGKKLNVGQILEGSVRIAGNRIRITAQLIDVADGYHLWSDRYDCEMEDIFAIQDDVTMSIVDNLKLELLKQEKALVLKRDTEDVEAFNFFLKGNHYFRMYGGKGFDEAIDCYQKALQKDPNYSMAYYGLSEVYIAMTYWGNVSPKEAIPKAKAYAKKALEIDNTNGEAHGALGFIHTIHDWDWKAGERELEHALELSPNSAMNRMYKSWLLANLEKHEEALVEALRAQVLDPISSFINAHVGLLFFFPGQFDRAAEELHKVIKMNPDSYLAHAHLGMVYTARSNMEGAFAEYKKAVECSDGVPYIEMLLAITFYNSGKKIEAENLFERLKRRAEQEYVPPTSFFLMNLILGKFGEARDWLKRAGEEHDSYLCWIRITPTEFYQNLREPKIMALLKKTGIKMMIGKTISRNKIVEENSEN